MEPEAELLKTMNAEELEEEVAAKIKSFHGLLTREVALRLIAKEKGLLKEEEKEYALAEIPKGARRVAVKARVRKIWPLAKYASGKSSRVVDLEDANASLPLVLWNEDAELAKGLRLKDMVVVKGANERNGELHLGYSGTIDVTERASFAKLDALSEHETVHVRGFISTVDGFGTFVRGGRSYRAFSFMITDGGKERRCILSSGGGREDRLAPGDEVIIESGTVREGNIDIDSSSRIHVRRAKELLMGEVTKLDAGNERLVVGVGGRELAFEREDALRFLGVHAAEDIALSTVVELKKDTLLNTKVAVKIEEKDGRISVRG